MLVIRRDKKCEGVIIQTPDGEKITIKILTESGLKIGIDAPIDYGISRLKIKEVTGTPPIKTS